jgi:hypothetical protein
MSRNRDLIEVAVGGAVYIGLVGVIVGLALVFGERHLETITTVVFLIIMLALGFGAWKVMRNEEQRRRSHQTD